MNNLYDYLRTIEIQAGMGKERPLTSAVYEKILALQEENATLRKEIALAQETAQKDAVSA